MTLLPSFPSVQDDGGRAGHEAFFAQFIEPRRGDVMTAQLDRIEAELARIKEAVAALPSRNSGAPPPAGAPPTG